MLRSIRPAFAGMIFLVACSSLLIVRSSADDGGSGASRPGGSRDVSHP